MDKVGPTGQRVARRLNELRHERGYTLADLAKKLEDLGRPILLSALSKIENGQRRVDADDLVALARALEVSPNSLLLPDPAETEANVELTPTTTMDTDSAWQWAVRDRPAARPRALPAEVEVPVHRAIVAVDIEGSTTRTNVGRVALRTALFDIFDAALAASGIEVSGRDPLIDRGDGALELVHPRVPKTLLLTKFIPTLSEMLSEYNASEPGGGLRLRVAVHAGEVHYDNQGVFGESLDIVFRLLSAPEVKHALVRTVAPLVLVVSDDIYNSVVRHGYKGIDSAAFEQLVNVQVAGQSHPGWVRTD